MGTLCRLRRVRTLLVAVSGLMLATQPGTANAQTPDAQIVQGEIGPGALYELAVPADWNGDLVLYVKGLGMPPVALPDIGPLRDGLMALGYGVAYSSFSETGFVVKDGVLRTRQLRGIFAAHFGQPRRTYLMSQSLGAAMVLWLAEQNQEHYDGVLPTCGIVGGSQMAIDYFFNVRALFDYFYPGVLPEQPVSEAVFWTEVVADVGAAIFANPAPAVELAGIDQVKMSYLDPGELFQSIVFPLFFTSWDFYVDDLRARAHGHGFFDNTNTVYTGSSDDEALNAGVRRVAATPDARKYFEHWYEPSGLLTMPVLTLQNARDPVVPWMHLAKFTAVVEAAGRSEWLAERTIDTFGHCVWDPAQQLAAFQELVTWVETGIKPVP